jgi:hypothetical protein
MRPLSATESINPAINRTKAILFQPFQWGRSWKLAATAYLTVMGAIFFPTPLFFVLGLFPAHTHRPISLELFTGIFEVFFSVVMLVFFYIGARLEFVLFDIVLLKEKFVAPSWRRHAPHTWRWIGCKLILSLFLGVICALPLYFALRGLFQNMVLLTPGQPPSPDFIRTIFLFYAIIGTPIAFAVLCSSLLTNFVLPSIALENTTVREGLDRFYALCTAEPGAMAAFFVFKILLAIAGGIAMEAVILLIEVLVAIPFVLIAVLGSLLLRSVGEAGQLLTVTGGIVLLVLFAACLTYSMILIMGCLHVFFQAYALYFLGGRYPTLGDLLEPPVPNLLPDLPYAPATPPLQQADTPPVPWSPPSEPAV